MIWMGLFLLLQTAGGYFTYLLSLFHPDMGIPILIAVSAAALLSVIYFRKGRKPHSQKKQKPVSHLPSGTLINGRHQIMECVGQGGLGIVYSAQDVQLHRPVALKFVRSEHQKDPRIEQQFFKEAVHASQINHPNVVTIHDFGHYKDQPYIVMEFLNGKTLDEIKHRNDDYHTFRAIAGQLLEGLEVAHENKLFHGDIKPQNIMVVPCPTKNQPIVKLFDFGLSRILGKNLKQVIDEDDTILGSLNYMAPEQFRGDLVDARTDLYSAGIILYELLAGKLPFEAEDPHKWIERVVFEKPVPLREARPGIPMEIATTVMRMIDPEPNRRFQSATEALRAIAA
jgi:eukaryotic-like serine/threonine-protein kinase